MSGCVGGTNSTNTASTKQTDNQGRLVSEMPTAKVSPHEFKLFRDKDKERSTELLTKFPEHKEPTGNNNYAVNNLKDGLAKIPSHLLDRYNKYYGMIEYNSNKFTSAEHSLGVISKIAPTNPKKIVLNTHIDQRNYSQLQKDIAISEVVKLGFKNEYDKHSDLSSSVFSAEKKSALLSSYRDFIAKVISDDNNTPNTPQLARDFFFGVNSPFHPFSDANMIDNHLIEANKNLIQQALATAITNHGAMDSSYGNLLLSTRFPEVNKLVSNLYFEPHAEDAPNSGIPPEFTNIMNYVASRINVSSSAFNAPFYSQYISSSRLAQYIAIDQNTSQPFLDQASASLYSPPAAGNMIEDRVQKLIENGVGNCDHQAIAAAHFLKQQGFVAEVFQLDKTQIVNGISYKVPHWLVFSTDNRTGERYWVDPWRGIVIPEAQYNQYYADFTSITYSQYHNNVLANIYSINSFGARADQPIRFAQPVVVSGVEISRNFHLN